MGLLHRLKVQRRCQQYSKRMLMRSFFIKITKPKFQDPYKKAQIPNSRSKKNQNPKSKFKIQNQKSEGGGELLVELVSYFDLLLYCLKQIPGKIKQVWQKQNIMFTLLNYQNGYLPKMPNSGMRILSSMESSSVFMLG